MEDVETRLIASEPTTGTRSAASPTGAPPVISTVGAPIGVSIDTTGRHPATPASTSALVICSYGWGKEFRLYADSLVVDGRHYRLQELLHVHCACRTVLGVPSASLDLRFKSKKLTLRGIAAVDDARRVVEYLTPWCNARDMAFHQRVTRPVETPVPRGPDRGPRTLREKNWRWPETEKRYAQVDTMPIVPVPLRLARGEGAHYSTPATLCGEHIQETWRTTYPAQDHGLLILTDRRIIYIGRKSQVVLDYTRLFHVSRLRGAIAFEAEHWQKRMIFQVPRPDECAAFVEVITRALKREGPGN